MRRTELNLARRPFVNLLPVKRVTVLLWILGLVLAGVNALFYGRHFSGSGAQRREEAELQLKIEQEKERIASYQAQLAARDLLWQNQQAEFLNRKIAERSFSWSLLFDRLGEALPAEVRLVRLSPKFGRREGADSALAEGEVVLDIRGTARNGEALLVFVDSLFAHPGFRDPDLENELKNREGLLDFSLTAVYGAAGAGPGIAVADSDEGGLKEEPEVAGSEEGEAKTRPKRKKRRKKR